MNIQIKVLTIIQIPIKTTKFKTNLPQAEGGPPSRSCHKMVLDPVYRQIFVLGRYLERGLREVQSNIKSDFYLFDIATSSWTLITDDTAALGGPK